ncbi:hypothetical protein PTTG_10090 [Puccinia triticina 1-1 BBBD Race 1]|uniref:Uncharacterized protein n=2 Tax=Puccinia triticina TaxID=208348 RepID=A0A180G3Y6_PUCT1|nr:uncharacterized protein PtA15_18A397 [Puccinia triticina]OAV87152.1 hypothetical protein PTTG_10090 [Puccinia triticina 1-1 BBBD Race 1]WAQ93337.1 hypothetical protein PtA15_18A397 [Puccinia triticina]WAR63336.1 hypothetical protein PtB15_18B419 [Puccinia triticina]
MALKLLSFIIIAASYHHVIGRPFLHPVPAPVAHNPQFYTPSVFHHLSGLIDFKHPERLPDPADFRPLGTPKGELEVTQMPHDVFEAGTKLDQLATHELVWLIKADRTPLSEDNKAGWEHYGRIYAGLSKDARRELRDYIANDVLRVSVESRVRFEWSLWRATKPMWWTKKLTLQSYLPANEDIYLIKMGDLLKFGNNDPLSDNTNTKFKELDHLATELLKKQPRLPAINIGFLDDPECIVKGKKGLFKKRLTELRKGASGKVSTMTPEQKKKILKVMYWGHGFAPQDAEQFALRAREELDNTGKWDQLLNAEDWYASKKIINGLKNKFISIFQSFFGRSPPPPPLN